LINHKIEVGTGGAAAGGDLTGKKLIKKREKVVDNDGFTITK